MKTLKLKTMKKYIGFPDLFGSESVKAEILALHILSHINDKTINVMLQLPAAETGHHANKTNTGSDSGTFLDIILQNSIVDAEHEFLLGCGFCYIRRDHLMDLFPTNNRADVALWRREINDKIEIFSKNINYFLEVRVFDINPANASRHVEMTYYYHFNKKFPW